MSHEKNRKGLASGYVDIKDRETLFDPPNSGKIRIDEQDVSTGYAADKLTPGEGIELNVIEFPNGEKVLEISMGDTDGDGTTIIDGDLEVTGDITVAGTVDGVDISDFYDEFGTHNHNSLYYLKTETPEVVEDITGAMFTGNIETGINSVYDDVTGKINLEAFLGFSKFQFFTNTGTSGDDSLVSATGLLETPASGAHVQMFVNGVSMKLADGPSEQTTSVFYFKSTGGTIRAQGGFQIGDLLYFNGDFIGYDLEASDEVLVVYEIP